MKRNERTALAKKVTALALALMVGITFIPLMDGAFAADDQAKGSADKNVTILDDGTELEVDLSALPDDGSVDKDAITDSVKDSLAEGAQPEEKSDGTPIPSVKDADAKPADSVKAISEPVLAVQGSENSVSTSKTTENLSLTNLGGNRFRITGSVSGNYIAGVVIDNTVTKTYTNKPRTIDYTMAAGDYVSTGYHTIAVVLTNDNLAVFWYYIPVNEITATAPNKPGDYVVYSNFFEYRHTNYGSYYYDMYMDVNGQQFGPLSYYTKYTKYGLTPNSSFSTATYWAQSVKYAYDGKYYLFKGPSSTLSFRTGGDKLKIKKVKVKAVKVKKHKVKHYGYWSPGYYYSYWVSKRWTEKYWTYKLKFTVKLKKKPNASGVIINGVKRWGNKKKYSATSGYIYSYKKPRGKRAAMTVYSFKDNTYGAYSPMYSKKVKIK